VLTEDQKGARIHLSGLEAIIAGERSLERRATSQQGPFLSRGLRAVAVGLLFGFCLSKKAELLGEQKGALALALEFSAFSLLEGTCRSVQGERPLCFLRVGVWVFFFLF